MRMACKTALGALPAILLTKGQNIAAVTAPVSSHVAEPFETMRYPVVQLLFVRVGLRIGLADTFGDDLGIALFVACILAVFALHPCRVFEKVAT